MKKAARLLIADDDETDVKLALAALKSAGLNEEALVAADGQEAMDCLYRRGAYADLPLPQPALVLLDLKMPRMDGFSVIEQVKSDPELRSIPVVALTGSGLERDIRRAYALGVNGYIVKPMEFDEYTAAMGAAIRFWLEVNLPPPCCRLPPEVSDA